MKRIIKQCTSALLVACLTFTPVFASTYGTLIHQYKTPVSETGYLYTEHYWNESKSDLCTEHYFMYTPDETTAPTVAYGDSILSKLSLSDMATVIEETDKKIISGINGDFFVVNTGNPLGIVVTDGILRSSASYLSAIGFLSDGTAVIGKPELTITAHIDEYDLTVADINKVRTESGGYYLLTEDFSHTTQNTQDGVDVILSPLDDNLGKKVKSDDNTTLIKSEEFKIGTRVTCQVEEILDSSDNIEIPDGKFVLTINQKSSEFLVETLQDLSKGDTIEIDVYSKDDIWNDVDCAIGGLYRLLTDGTISDSLDHTLAPRTAVGIKEDGSVIFYTVDGRQANWSIGASLHQVAQRLLELGCVDAVCLDGGGSTNIGSTLPCDDHFSIVNQPSDTNRPITNALFLVSTKQGTGDRTHIYIQPESRTLLSGARTTINTSFADETWSKVNSNKPITLSAKYGTIDDNGIYTAPLKTVVDTISAISSDNVTGVATISVFHNPTEITISRNSQNTPLTKLNASPSEYISLQANVFNYSLPLTADDTQLSWSVTPENLATIDNNGNLTASAVQGDGTVTVSYGDTKTSIPLHVDFDMTRSLLEDFEDADDLIFNTNQANVKISKTNVPSKVALGKYSMQVNYATKANDFTINTDFTIGPNQKQLQFWVYLKNPSVKLSLNCQDDQQIHYALPITLTDADGWQQVQVALPANTNRITGITLSGNLSSGQVLFDHFSTANYPVIDSTPPNVSLSITENEGSAVQTGENAAQLNYSITANITDTNETPIKRSNISLTANGKEIDFTFQEATGTLETVFQSNPSTIQQITLTAKDLSGNISRTSKTIEPTSQAEFVFSDMTTHWAKPYTIAMQQHGITTGIATETGIIFKPDNSITRGDFALMATRWMELDLSKYEDVNLPFVDVDDIPFWSINAVKAMYQLGIMKGSAGANGLYANAQDSITRAEAMTILGRILPKGFGSSNITNFNDANLVPNWANPYISTLIEQEIVTGYENRLRPNDPVSRAEVAKLLFSSW